MNMKHWMTALALVLGASVAHANEVSGFVGLSEEEAIEFAQANFGGGFGIEIGRTYKCVAQNLRGMQTVGHGRSRQQAANIALRKCYNIPSRRCDIVRCKGSWGVGIGVGNGHDYDDDFRPGRPGRGGGRGDDFGPGYPGHGGGHDGGWDDDFRIDRPGQGPGHGPGFPGRRPR